MAGSGDVCGMDGGVLAVVRLGGRRDAVGHCRRGGSMGIANKRIKPADGLEAIGGLF